MSCHVRWGSWARVVVVCSLANHSREKCDCVTSIENKSLQLRASGPHSWWSLIKSSEKLKSAGNDNWYLLAGVGTLQLGRFWIWSANSLLVNHVKETHSLSWKILLPWHTKSFKQQYIDFAPYVGWANIPLCARIPRGATEKILGHCQQVQ